MGWALFFVQGEPYELAWGAQLHRDDTKLHELHMTSLWLG